MRILLDENVDWRLRSFFDPHHEVITVTEKGWRGKKNGDLLRSASQEFDVLVTLDANIRFQHPVGSYSIGILLIRSRSSRKQDVAPLMPAVNKALHSINSGQVVVVDG